MKPGFIEKLPYKVHIFDVKKGWAHNVSIANDDKHQTWIAIRYHDTPYKSYGIHWQPSILQIGKLNTKTLAVTDLKIIIPDPTCPLYLFTHSIEDVRIFHRQDGLHAIGVAFPRGGVIRDKDHGVIYTHNEVGQVEILIDYQAGTYSLIRDYGQPNGRTEKNWVPSIPATELFDFIYSPTQVVKHGIVRGSNYTGDVHGGSQLLPYKDGWISIAHRVVPIAGVTARWYMHFAQLHDQWGFVTHTSQFFDFGTGWWKEFQQSVEFVAGAIWTVPEKELLLSLGVRDQTCGFVRVPISALEWRSVNSYYRDFSIDPKLEKTVKFHTPKKRVKAL